MNNQVIGIIGVFVLTLFLLVLRHILLIWGQPSKRRHLRQSPPERVARDTTEDDSWLLLSPDDKAVMSAYSSESTRRAHDTGESGKHPYYRTRHASSVPRSRMVNGDDL